jgi:hypothetical protein
MRAGTQGGRHAIGHAGSLNRASIERRRSSSVHHGRARPLRRTRIRRTAEFGVDIVHLAMLESAAKYAR